MKRSWFAFALAVGALSLAGGCGDDDDEEKKDPGGSPEQTGKSCATKDDCYPDVSHADLKGQVVCDLLIRDGYCTHTCGSDADCCAIDKECETDINQVCANFESKGQKCYLSCESADIGGMNEQEYCQRKVSPDFICRASGGGDPRKICVPAACGVGAACAAAADCTGGLECVTDLKGGYCGKKGCSTNADCPADSACVTHGGANYCFFKCTDDAVCRSCRAPDDWASCRDDVTYADGTTTGKVCVPPA
jgi:hypothetical protein